MISPYRYDVLPLDTADDDPRWVEYVDVFRAGFLDSWASPAGVATFRAHRRHENATLGFMAVEGQSAHTMAGAFNSAIGSLNVGTLQPVLIVNSIAVRPEHRRNGLLRDMMRIHLDAARGQGVALATLTASEATIYGRFGFGVALRREAVHVDTRRFGFHDGVPVAEGRIEFVRPSFLEPHLARIAEAHQRRYRGALAPQHAHHLIATGLWDSNEQGPAKNLRAVAHFGADGEPDGFAVFKHKGWDSTPITTQVDVVVAAEPAVERALWRALAGLDLVERLSYPLSHPGDPLPMALADKWAVKVDEADDFNWLRILDLPAATAQRTFEADGSVVVEVNDPMGYCAGTWRIDVEDGVGAASPADGPADAVLGVDALAAMWLGDRTAAELALAGRVHGDGVAKLSRLFQTGESPINLWWI